MWLNGLKLKSKRKQTPTNFPSEVERGYELI